MYSVMHSRSWITEFDDGVGNRPGRTDQETARRWGRTKTAAAGEKEREEGKFPFFWFLLCLVIIMIEHLEVWLENFWIQKGKVMEEEPEMDPEVAEMMGFGGFGSSKKSWGSSFHHFVFYVVTFLSKVSLIDFVIYYPIILWIFVSLR